LTRRASPRSSHDPQAPSCPRELAVCVCGFQFARARTCCDFLHVIRSTYAQLNLTAPFSLRMRRRPRCALLGCSGPRPRARRAPAARPPRAHTLFSRAVLSTRRTRYRFLSQTHHLRSTNPRFSPLAALSADVLLLLSTGSFCMTAVSGDHRKVSESIRPYKNASPVSGDRRIWGLGISPCSLITFR